jgi:hypothetical protein
MKKSQAIKHARSVVSELSPLGDNYTYTVYDPEANAWRQSTPLNYYQAQAHRSEALVNEARKAMMGDEFTPVRYDGGRWESYL